MSNHINSSEPRVAVLVDRDNVSPDILEHALLMTAQFGRVVLRRGYGNQATLANKWQDALVRLAFTPCLQYQYASGKNTVDIALALNAIEALFDRRVDTFCLVTAIRTSRICAANCESVVQPCASLVNPRRTTRWAMRATVLRVDTL